MSQRSSKWSARKLARRTSQGYGSGGHSGEPSLYMGWLAIQDFVSRGTTTRLTSLELRRTTLSLPNIELDAFLASAAEEGLSDHREQFHLGKREPSDNSECGFALTPITASDYSKTV